jgi:hypothetical protein
MIVSIRTLLSLMLLVALSSAQVLTQSNQSSSLDTQYPARDYSTIGIEMAREGQNKPLILKSVRVRFVKADGQWKQLIVSTSGKITLHWAKPDGIYFGEPGKLYQRGEFVRPPELFHSTKFLRTHSQFVREESLLGHKVYVLRGASEKDSFTEMYQSPEVGFLSLKTVLHLSGGQESVIEAIKLEFAEVTDQMLSDESPSGVAKYVAEAIKAVEGQGRKEVIEGLKEIQRRLQAKMETR